MATTNNRKPDIGESYDYYEDRVYYKKTGWWIFESKVEVKRDRIEEHTTWHILCKNMPDKILVNGEKYKLVKV